MNVSSHFCPSPIPSENFATRCNEEPVFLYFILPTRRDSPASATLPKFVFTSEPKLNPPDIGRSALPDTNFTNLHLSVAGSNSRRFHVIRVFTAAFPRRAFEKQDRHATG